MLLLLLLLLRVCLLLPSILLLLLPSVFLLLLVRILLVVALVKCSGGIVAELACSGGSGCRERKAGGIVGWLLLLLLLWGPLALRLLLGRLRRSGRLLRQLRRTQDGTALRAGQCPGLQRAFSRVCWQPCL